MMKYYNLLLASLLILSCQKTDTLSEMNNVVMPDYEVLKHTVKSTDTLKILIIGNSITSHVSAPNIGWNYKAGMAATTIENDYVHILFNKLSKYYTLKNLILRFANYSQFERNPESFDITIDEKIKQCYTFNPQIVIYQLGDNTSAKNSGSFTEKSIQFLKHFPTSKIIVLSPFFMTDNNFKSNKLLAAKTKATFLNISHISKAKENRALNSLNPDWKSKGIGQHPGDIGMQNIANEIFNTITQDY